MSQCILKKCSEYKICLKKKNPFEGNNLCNGYKKYVEQDCLNSKGTQIEIPFSSIGFNIQMVNNDMENNIFNNNGKSLKELIIQMFFFDKEKPKHIQSKLDCNISYIYEIIRECKAKLLKNNNKNNFKKFEK